jgi:hypothetical protein
MLMCDWIIEMVTLEPEFKTQLDAFGNPEKVDITIYQTKIVCQELNCLRVRYVKNQDRGQCKYCKPHARKHLLAKRAQRARLARLNLESSS